MTRRVVLVNWGSIEDRHLTVGDHLATAVVQDALNDAAVPHRLLRADETILDGEPEPGSTAKVWVCGPVDRSYGPQHEIIGDGNDWTLLDATVLRSRADSGHADLRFARDGEGLPTRGDIASLAELSKGGFAVLVLRGRQPEYRVDADTSAETAQIVTGAIERLGLLPVSIDTILPPILSASQTGSGIEALMRAATVVISSRLHGCIHALRAGQVPVVIDEVRGGGKVSAMAEAFEFPVLVPAHRIASDTIALAVGSVGRLAVDRASDILLRIQQSAAENLQRFIEHVQHPDE